MLLGIGRFAVRVITAAMGNDASAKLAEGTLVYAPTDEGGSVSWDCTGSTIEQKYLPSACRGG